MGVLDYQIIFFHYNIAWIAVFFLQIIKIVECRDELDRFYQ